MVGGGSFVKEETIMPTFISMVNWTDQGFRSVKDAPKRTAAAREAGKKFGVDVKEVFLTSGDFDLLVISEAPHYDNVAKFILTTGMQGNIRSRTIRAWTEPEMAKLISELP
jgi:uncharacterized protein with GYD domain